MTAKPELAEADMRLKFKLSVDVEEGGGGWYLPFEKGNIAT